MKSQEGKRYVAAGELHDEPRIRIQKLAATRVAGQRQREVRAESTSTGQQRQRDANEGAWQWSPCVDGEISRIRLVSCLHARHPRDWLVWLVEDENRG